jgi:hypothetical protein
VSQRSGAEGQKSRKMGQTTCSDGGWNQSEHCFTCEG